MFLNNSKAELFEDCPRKFFFQEEFNDRGLQSTFRNDNLDFGTIVHIGLGAFYSGEAFPPLISREEGKKILDFDNMYFEDRNKWADHFDWIGRILGAYGTFAQQNDDFTTIQIEAEGCVVLGEICYRCGDAYPAVNDPEQLLLCPKCATEINHWVFRIDLAVNRGEHHPTVQIIDHKTTSSLGENYLLQWHNSFQLWGYCYGYQKQSGLEVSGYLVNIIRKLKGIGLEEETSKTCPECRNGARKKLNCTVCSSSGKVQREVKSDDMPFVREEDSWNSYKQEIFVRNRLNTVTRIQDEQERFKHEPDAAWPMNPKACFKMGRCPFWKLCYTPNDPEKWYMPTDDQLINFEPKDLDYVTVKQMAREEMI